MKVNDGFDFFGLSFENKKKYKFKILQNSDKNFIHASDVWLTALCHEKAADSLCLASLLMFTWRRDVGNIILPSF